MALLAGMGVAAWLAVVLDDPDADPDHAAIATVALFAAPVCAYSFFKLTRVGRARDWGRTLAWVAVAVLTLLVLVIVAYATRLTG